VGTTEDPGDGRVLGIGDASDGPVRAIAAGGYQTCALTDAGRVWCWGSNHTGQVGTGEVTAAPVRAPTLVRGIGRVAALALGDTVSCAITTDAALYCWGDNSQAQIDDSGRTQRPTPTRVAGIERAEQVAVGNYHLCVVGAGRVICRGQLAPLARDVAALDEVSGISAGWGHSCALRRGVPYCWGRSYLGVLGLGRSCPEGTSSNCDADVLYPPRPVPGVSGAVQIGGHDYHTCVRLESGGVTCWGNNQGHAFADDLAAEPWQTAHEVAAFEGVDACFVGGVHVCALRDGVPACVGNDWAGAVRGAPTR
jgi:alpha-tubulin suppressor-like RCC1 family protein